MKTVKLLILGLMALSLLSCGTARKTGIKTTGAQNKAATHIIQNAQTFLGTRYRYGGEDKQGMDCSGLVYTSFLMEGISLPRTTRDLSKRGKRIDLKETHPGDLLFFGTGKDSRVINHVGLVVDWQADQVVFIHASTSRGVILSTLEHYWREHFVMARRLL